MDLPLNKFIECACDSNLSALIISGFPSPDELLLTWADIIEQHAEAMGDIGQKLYTKLFKEITVLSIDYRQISALVEILHSVKYKPFEARLNALLYTNYSFEENRTKELEVCTRLSKSILVKIDIKTARLEAMKTKQKDGKKPTREYYHSCLITLSDHAQYLIPDTITVFDFCERMKRLNEYLERQQKQIKKKHGGR